MTIKTVLLRLVLTFMGGSNFCSSDMSAGTDGQVLKINGSGETYWDDASSNGTITGNCWHWFKWWWHNWWCNCKS